MVDTSNVAGHRARLNRLLGSSPRQEALESYVGGGARYSIGHREKEAVAKYHTLEQARIVDIGCGIGRLTQALAEQPIAHYLGTDIFWEVLDEAAATVAGDRRFQFEQVSGLDIPAADESADVVCAFSVMTHLLDEQVFAYFLESSRVLKAGGVAVFSFLDYALPKHRENFVKFAREDRGERRDVLKWFEKDTLSFFAAEANLETIEFQDAYTTSPAKFPRQTLLDGSKSADVLVMGQSLVYFRKC